MDFQKKLRQRLYVMVSYIVLGIVLIIVNYFQESKNHFLLPFGIALIVMGILRILEYRKITATEKNIRRQELLETDERNRMIAERARSWAFSCSILIAGTVGIVLSLLDKHDLAQPFAWFVCLMTLVYWICWYIIQKKY